MTNIYEINTKEELIFAKGSVEVNSQEALHLLAAIITHSQEVEKDDYTEEGHAMIENLVEKIYDLHLRLGAETDANPHNQKLFEKWRKRDAFIDSVVEGNKIN